MSQSNNILQELKELESSLLGAGNENIYTVPNGYFEGLADQVLNRIKALEAKSAYEELGHLSPLLSSISKQMPYELPVGYFENLEAGTTAIVQNDQTAKEEIEALSPLLSGLSKKMPYSVPENYFEKLSANEQRTDTKPVAKVVSIGKRKWFRLAAAAMIAGIIALGTIMYFNISGTVSPVKQPYAWVEKSLKKVDVSEVNDFVKLADEELPDQTLASAPVKPEEIKELMKDVSDKEIQDFLNDTPNDSDDDDVMLN